MSAASSTPNVLISALLQPSGRTGKVLEAIRASGGVLIFSDETFAELASRLARPKFDRYLDQAIRRQFLSDLAAVAEWVAITGAVRACRDPDDDKVLETAIRARRTASSPATGIFWRSTRSRA